MRIYDRPPFYIRVAASLPYGRHRARAALRAAGLLAGAAPFPFHDKHVTVPLDDPGVWNGIGYSTVQIKRVRAFASVCDAEMASFDLLDCGAHLGLVSAQFLRMSRNVRRVIAIEPNAGINGLTLDNIRAGGAAEVRLVRAGIADYDGRATLRSPAYDTSDEGKFIQQDPDGDLDVITMGTLAPDLGPRLAIKLDIEGAEVPAMQAASAFLRSRETIVVMVELHRDVLARIGMTPVRFLQALGDIRPFRWTNAGNPGQTIDAARDVWEQTTETRQIDLIGVA